MPKKMAGELSKEFPNKFSKNAIVKLNTIRITKEIFKGIAKELLRRFQKMKFPKLLQGQMAK